MAVKAIAAVTAATDVISLVSLLFRLNTEKTPNTEASVANPTHAQIIQAKNSISLSFSNSAQASLSGNYSNKLVRQHPPPRGKPR